MKKYIYKVDGKKAVMIDRPYIRAWRKTVHNLRVDIVCYKFVMCFVVYRNVRRYENLELVENLFVRSRLEELIIGNLKDGCLNHCLLLLRQ